MWVLPYMDYNTVTVALCSTNVNNRSVLILTIVHSGFVSGTTKFINPLFFVPFAPHLSCLSKHDPIVLLRQLHDSLYVAENS